MRRSAAKGNPNMRLLPILILSAAAALAPAPAAQTLVLATSVDMTAKSTLLRFKATGAPGATCYLLAAASVQPGIPTPWGTLYLDPATLQPLASFKLNAAGAGSIDFLLPADKFPDLRASVQGVIVGGPAPVVTGFVLVGHYATKDLTEILVADYASDTDMLAVNGKGRGGDLIEAFRGKTGVGWVRLASTTVPYAMMYWGILKVGFVAGSELEVRVRGTVVLFNLH
jgi:hypothetical protein